MPQLQLSLDCPAVWCLALAAGAVNGWLAVHNGEHTLQGTLGLGDVREAHLQQGTAHRVKVGPRHGSPETVCGSTAHQVAVSTYAASVECNTYWTGLPCCSSCTIKVVAADAQLHGCFSGAVDSSSLLMTAVRGATSTVRPVCRPNAPTCACAKPMAAKITQKNALRNSSNVALHSAAAPTPQDWNTCSAYTA